MSHIVMAHGHGSWQGAQPASLPKWMKNIHPVPVFLFFIFIFLYFQSVPAVCGAALNLYAVAASQISVFRFKELFFVVVMFDYIV